MHIAARHPDHEPVTPQPRSLPAQPRARGRGLVQVRHARGQTVLEDLVQSGSTKLLFPRSHSGMTAVILNTAGGVTGGDQFAIRAEAGAQSHLTLTTQAAERAYRAQPGETGEVETHLTLGPKARLFWLPQETILFDGASLRRRLSVDMAPDADLLMVEPLILGRTAMGETLHDFSLHDRIDLRVGGALRYADRTRLDGPSLARSGPATLGAHGAAANLVLAGHWAEAQLDRIRNHLTQMPDGAIGGASLIGPDVLACRLLARTGYALRCALVPLLETLTASGLPRPWML